MLLTIVVLSVCGCGNQNKGKYRFADYETFKSQHIYQPSGNTFLYFSGQVSEVKQNEENIDITVDTDDGTWIGVFEKCLLSEKFKDLVQYEYVTCFGTYRGYIEEIDFYPMITIDKIEVGSDTIEKSYFEKYSTVPQTTIVTKSTTTSTTVPPTTKSLEELRSDYISSCETISFRDLARNPNKHKGEKLKFTGQVIQVQESDSIFGDTTQVDLRINVTKDEYGLWNDTILATVELPEDADKILEDDIITIWGECEGDYTYESVLGSNITLPLINVEYFEIN